MINNAAPEKPGRMAWFVFRSLARYLVSLFIPTFRYFGETNIKKTGHIFIEKNYGFQSWAYPLTIFKRPMRFIVADMNCDMQWYNTVADGGLFPVKLTGILESDYELIKTSIDNNENIILIIPQDEDNIFSNQLIQALKKDYINKISFMALSSGANYVFANNAVIPKNVNVTMVCGMPFVIKKDTSDNNFEELHMLEASSESATDVTEPHFLAYYFNK